jgi:hypothetical protein
MNTLSVLTLVWSIVAAAFVALMVYRANLANHETDQLFLNDEETVSSNHKENDRIVHLLNVLSPICKGVGGATVILSFAIAGIWLSHILIVPGA